jgi:SAM-dependent methyltransferase
MTAVMDFLDRLHPERAIGGFTKHDQTVRFYNFVKAAMASVAARKVLDFGAGRGGPLTTQRPWLRELQDLRQGGAEVWAADIDPAVRDHPASDHQVVIEAGDALPFADGFFDLIVSDWVFEHIEHPEAVAPELLRVVRPGGFICARTPSKLGYIKIAASLVPNRLHLAVLSRVQPGRKEKDVFPTVYKMNTVARIRKLFPGCTVHWYRDNGDPGYFFDSRAVYGLFRLVHRLLPDRFANTLCYFIRKEPVPPQA